MHIELSNYRPPSATRLATGAPGAGAEQGDPAPGAAAGAGHLPALHRAAAPAGRRGPRLPPHVRQVFLRGAGQHRAAQGALEQPGHSINWVLRRLFLIVCNSGHICCDICPVSFVSMIKLFAHQVLNTTPDFTESLLLLSLVFFQKFQSLFYVQVKCTWYMLFKIISEKMSEGYCDTRNSRITLIPFEQRYALFYLIASIVNFVQYSGKFWITNNFSPTALTAHF